MTAPEVDHAKKKLLGHFQKILKPIELALILSDLLALSWFDQSVLEIYTDQVDIEELRGYLIFGLYSLNKKTLFRDLINSFYRALLILD